MIYDIICWTVEPTNILKISKNGIPEWNFEFSTWCFMQLRYSAESDLSLSDVFGSWNFTQTGT